MNCDGDHRCARTGSGSQNPFRRGCSKEQSGKSKDHNETRNDEGESTDDRPWYPSHGPRTKDRQLRRRRTRQQVACGDGVFELTGHHPMTTRDT
jgi:hypothetical protein